MTFHRAGKALLTSEERTHGIGREHALLFYHYLDANDQDGCASLMDPGARFTFPGGPVARGPEEAARLVCARFGGERSHKLYRVISQGDVLAVTGHLETANGGSGHPLRSDFADIFTLTEHGLLLAWSRFHSLR